MIRKGDDVDTGEAIYAFLLFDSGDEKLPAWYRTRLVNLMKDALGQYGNR